jgi:hypothetical protein
MAKKASVIPNITKHRAELRFREILQSNRDLRKKLQAEGWMGIMFEPAVIELLPFDPETLQQYMKPPTQKEIKNEVLTPK